MRSALFIVGVVVVGAFGQTKPEPQYKRMLPRDVAKQAKELEEKIAQQTTIREMVAVTEELLALRKKHQGDDHWEVRDVQNLLDDFNLPLLTPAQAAKRDEAAKLNQQALALFEAGNARDAFPITAKTLTLLKDVYGPDHREMAAVYNNVAAMYHSQGRYTEALTMFKEVTRIQKKTLGEQHPIYAKGLTNLGLLYDALGKPDDAEQVLASAVRIHQDVYGPKHRDTARSMGALARVYLSQQRIAEAEQQFAEALRINQETVGAKHQETADSMRDLAEVYEAQRRYPEAMKLLQQALAISNDVRRKDHPRTASMIHRLGAVYLQMGQYAKAEALLQQSFDMRRTQLGEGHPETAQSRGSLAALYHTQGKYAQAIALALANQQMNMKLLGEWHPETGTSLQNLARIYHSQGKFTEAEPLYQQAIRVFQANAAGANEDTAHSMVNLAELYTDQQKYSAAEPLFREALATRKKLFGDQHPRTAGSLNNLAGLLLTLRNFDEAERLYEQAHRINLAVHGPMNRETAATGNNVGLVKIHRGKYDEAERLFREASTTLQAIHGEYHHRTSDSLNNLALLAFVQGKHEQAMALAAKATRGYEASRTIRAANLERGLENFTNPYPFRAIIAARQGQAREALQLLELDLARGLLDSQTAQRESLSAEEKQQRTTWVERIRAIEPRIATLAVQVKRTSAEDKELDALNVERQRLDEQLLQLASTISQREVADVKAIQQSLGKDEAFVTWVDLDLRNMPVHEHWAVILRAEGEPQWVRLSGRGPEGAWTAEDKDVPKQLRNALTADRVENVDTLVKQLHEQRMAPLLKHLVGVKTLYVATVRDMAGIPIETIALEHTICYVPSGTYLARRAKPSVQPVRMLALGDPVFHDEKASDRRSLPPSGLLVTYVLPGGSAAQARINVHDALLTYAGITLESDEQFAKLIAQKADEKSITITVWREVDGQTVEREIPAGRMGIIVAKDPAKTALASRRALAKQLSAATRGERWEELPGTLAEVRQLEALLGKDRVTTLLRAEACEQRLEQMRQKGELVNYRYLHLATHGQANALRPFDSTLILAQRQARETTAAVNGPLLDNELTAAEVLAFWKLNADLVTLSACESALGQHGGGDGLLGFAQAFLLAGSRSVCLSLWKVDDTATALLMDRFYRNLLGKHVEGAKPMTKALALDEAKRWLRNLNGAEAEERLGTLTKGLERGSKKGRDVVGTLPMPQAKETKPFAHPRYWAAFVLVGSPD